jgi:alpha-galactosidase
MRFFRIPFFLMAWSLGLVSLHAAADTASLDLWKNNHPPLSFKYGGEDSSRFIASWHKTEGPVTPSEGGETHHYTYTDPVTKLKIAADVRTFTDFPAVEWLLHFTNGGTIDTPILENIAPLDWTLTADAENCTVHYARGEDANPSDFEPLELKLRPGVPGRVQSVGGESAKGALPFFNLETGGGGVICGIGWSGDWSADFLPDPTGKTIDLHAGMKQTHLLLHPGETIRTPRILLVNWKGNDWLLAQNLWRRLMIAHYAPKDSTGHVPLGPLCSFTMGTPIDEQLAEIKAIHDWKLPVDVYWVDAGWYGDVKKSWSDNRGDWDYSPVRYPHGLKPLGDAAAQAGLRLLLWMMPEVAVPGSKLLTQHPDWFMKARPASVQGTAMLNLGDPTAWKGLVDLVSKTLTDSGATWFRNDYPPQGPAIYWHDNDTPDRVGMTEIRYVEGFYAYWDELVALHPGLLIDDCSDRQDIETLPRSFDLWRSDMTYGAYEPSVAQMQTQGISLWIPRTAGVFGAPPSLAGSNAIYALRSAYCSALQITIDPRNTDKLKWFQQALPEYIEARPYFYGDFYPMLAYNRLTDQWTAWQWDRPDLKSGIFLLLRRKDSPFSTFTLTPHALDPGAKYAVEIRTDFAKKPVQTLSGTELNHLKVTIPDKPGSVLIFYHRL